MLPFNIMALFCEDIREEKGDIFTLIGIIPDTVHVESSQSGAIESGKVQRVLVKLCLYIRINFDPDFDLGTPRLQLALPDGEILALGEIRSETMRKAQSDAKTKGHLLAGVVARTVLIGFKPPEGTIKAEVDINGTIHLAGALTFAPKEAEPT